MSTFDILAKFLEMFPQFHKQICQYAPNGHNRITVYFKNGQELDFTYNNDIDWNLVNHKKYTYSNHDIVDRWRFLR